MTNSLTVVAKVFSDTLIFLLQKCEWLLHYLLLIKYSPMGGQVDWFNFRQIW